MEVEPPSSFGFPKNFNDLSRTSFIPKIQDDLDLQYHEIDDDSMEVNFLPPMSRKAIEISSVLGSDSLRFDSTHKLWGMINLKVNNQQNVKNSFIDFVVVVDISASMLLDKTLAFVQSSIHYLLTELNETHRLALVFFNHKVFVESELAYCNEENKGKFIHILENLQASGSTNISEALYAGNKILLDREESTKNRISTLILITDGLSNTGLSSQEMLSNLDNLTLPLGCVFNTFGFGEDHDSKLLHSIALKAQGVYYYISSSELIHQIFGGCIKSILNSRAKHVKISFQGQDGCRIVKIATPFQANEKVKAKEYDINVGLMYREEFKTILFCLSLRKMNKPMLKHLLLKINVQYYDIDTSSVENIKKELTIERREFSRDQCSPLSLDQNLNRYNSVKSILEAIDLSNRLQFSDAQQKLTECIQKISQSSSGQMNYCYHLMEDLKECRQAMRDSNAFQTGIHIAHSYASMYYMERSSGIEIKKYYETQSEESMQDYGYLTNDQKDLDTEKTTNLLRKYLKNKE